MAEPAAPDDFLLASSSGRTAAFPIRSGNEVKPLMSGDEAFKAMETAIANAKRYVYIAGWTFWPRLPCSTNKDKTWNQLLLEAGQRAEVRLLLNDMDPANKDYHQNAWAAYRALIATAGKVEKKKGKRFEVICSLHRVNIELLSLPEPIVTRLNTYLRRHTGRDIKEYFKGTLDTTRPGATERLKNMPLLWQNIRYDDKQRTFVLADTLDLTFHPASHHQKTCIVDGNVAFCGGIDITYGRRGEGWRDVHCQVEGAVVADLEADFANRWNSELPRFRAFVALANSRLTDEMKSMSFELPLRKNTPITASVTSSKRGRGHAFAQVHRTASEPSEEGLTGVAVSAVRGGSIISSPTSLEIKEVYRRAIMSARHYIYIENQYVRATEIAQSIVERLQALGPKSQLQVIIVVPSSVEEKDKILTPYGRFLQKEAFKQIEEAFRQVGLQQNFGVFAKRRGYVHSKVMIVDDQFATIGSANANPRSFELDTEANLSWHHGISVKKLRESLWATLLGNPKGMAEWPPSDYVKKWRAVALLKSSPIQPHVSPGGDGTLGSFLPDVLV